MKYIITENQKDKIRLLRRLQLINPAVVDFFCDVVHSQYSICTYKIKKFYEEVQHQIIMNMLRGHFAHVSTRGNDWDILSGTMSEYIHKHFYDSISKYYNDKCQEPNT